MHKPLSFLMLCVLGAHGLHAGKRPRDDTHQSGGREQRGRIKKPKHTPEEWLEVVRAAGIDRVVGVRWDKQDKRWRVSHFANGVQKQSQVPPSSCDREGVRDAHRRAVELLEEMRSPNPSLLGRISRQQHSPEEWLEVVQAAEINVVWGVTWSKRNKFWQVRHKVNGLRKTSSVSPSSCDPDGVRDAHRRAVALLAEMRSQANSCPVTDERSDSDLQADECTSGNEQAAMANEDIARWSIGP